MRTISAILLMVLVFACSAQGSLKSSAESLDSAIKQTNLKTALPELAKLLELESADLEKALVETKLKLSDVVLAKWLAEKQQQPIKTWLTTGMAADWLKILKQHDLSEQAAEAYLDDWQTEVAMLMMDLREKKRK